MSLWKTDFIYRASFTPGLQQGEWQKAADEDSMRTRCDIEDGVTTSSNKIVPFNTANALTTFRSSIHSKIQTWCVLGECKPTDPQSEGLSQISAQPLRVHAREAWLHVSRPFLCLKKIPYATADNVGAVN